MAQSLHSENTATGSAEFKVPEWAPLTLSPRVLDEAAGRHTLLLLCFHPIGQKLHLTNREKVLLVQDGNVSS